MKHKRGRQTHINPKASWTALTIVQSEIKLLTSQRHDFVLHRSDSTTNGGIDFFLGAAFKSTPTTLKKSDGSTVQTDASLTVALPSAPPGSTPTLPSPTELTPFTLPGDNERGQ